MTIEILRKTDRTLVTKLTYLRLTLTTPYKVKTKLRSLASDLGSRKVANSGQDREQNPLIGQLSVDNYQLSFSEDFMSVVFLKS